jgi:putative DNA primase/helicase
MQSKTMMDWELDYIGRGWKVLDWPEGSKGGGPRAKGWQDRHLTEDDVRRLHEPHNIGVRLGEPSGWLVDVDLDSDEARETWGHFAPSGAAVFGRDGNPRSHHLYRAEGAESEAFRLRVGTDEDGKPERALLLEIRSTNLQTIFPPSTHPTGDRYRWEREPGAGPGEPAEIEAADLRRACLLAATAAAISRFLPNRGGGRHDFLLPMAGYLLRPGRLGEDEATKILVAAGDAGGHPDAAEAGKWRGEVARVIEKAAERLANGEPVSGGPTLVAGSGQEVGWLLDALALWWGWEKREGKPTDDELADRFLSENPGTAYGQSEWKRYEGGVWRLLDDANANRLIKRVLTAAKPEGVKPTSGLLTSVERMARVEVAVADDAWDADPEILVCENGALHVPTRELRSHSPEHRATAAVPYAYDPDAKAPAWGAFLSDRFSGEEALFLQEFFGYCLTPDVYHEIALWLYGPPGGGRSTLIAGAEAMLGEKTGTLGLRKLERSQFALSKVPGKTLLTATEQPAGYVGVTDILNALISGDKLEVERKFRDPYDIYPRAKIMWAMNELPRISSANDGIFRRVKLLKMTPIPPEERDPEVKERVRTEGAGILNWSLDGLDRLRGRGGFQIPASMQAAVEHWRESNDTAAMFVEEACGTGPNLWASAGELYDAYRRWCEGNGYKAKSRNRVAEDWERLGFTRTKVKGVYRWNGVRVKADFIYPRAPF